MTPKYTKYEYAKSPSFDRMTSDGSKVAQGIKSHSRTAKKWTSVDVDIVAHSAQVNREDVVRRLQQWNDAGAVELRPSGVVARFRVLKQFPQDEESKENLVAEIYAQIETREKEDMAKIEAVIGLVSSGKCLSRELARHFGDEGSVPEAGCGNCQSCLKLGKVEFFGGGDRKGRVDEARLRLILSATATRDDARFLARIAFGISSPRVTGEKLGTHAVFGSMDDCDFEVCIFSLFLHLLIYTS